MITSTFSFIIAIGILTGKWYTWGIQIGFWRCNSSTIGRRIISKGRVPIDITLFLSLTDAYACSYKLFLEENITMCRNWQKRKYRLKMCEFATPPSQEQVTLLKLLHLSWIYRWKVLNARYVINIIKFIPRWKIEVNRTHCCYSCHNYCSKPAHAKSSVVHLVSCRWCPTSAF